MDLPANRLLGERHEVSPPPGTTSRISQLDPLVRYGRLALSIPPQIKLSQGAVGPAVPLWRGVTSRITQL